MKLIVLTELILLTAIINAQEIDYRLPKTVYPVLYTINLTVFDETFTEKDAVDFKGEVTIDAHCVEDADEIILHASSYLNIEHVSINGTTQPAGFDEKTETISIPGPYQKDACFEIKITYSGKHSNDMKGFYKSSYEENDVTKYLVTTQFEPTFARRAFPCFDEPEFKAAFVVSITHPETLTALSNTQAITNIDDTRANTLTTNFGQSPVMSSYLVAFIVSEFTCSTSHGTSPFVHSVCSRQETSDMREFALEDGPKIMTALNRYMGINYQEYIRKMEQVAIPDFSAGAMENWGLVTYREQYLLWSETESSTLYKQYVSTIIAHEFAHMWFGNLVTTKWWNTLFLNEGFASYFEYFITAEVHPKWELEKQFITDQFQVALAADDLTSAPALVSDVSSPDEIQGKFDTITYQKGACILRMIEHFMGSENFKEGLRKYLDTWKSQSTVPENLWTALTELLGEDITPFVENWINKPGFPLITVKLSQDGNVELSQERFLRNSNESESTKWYVPITYTLSTDENKFENTSTSIWLKPTVETEKINLHNSEWIILNNQVTGYYRVNYDDELWDKIKEALFKDNFDEIPEVNRAQIADDIFNLAKVGKLNYTRSFSILEFLKNDTSYYSWNSALNGFNFLIRQVGTEGNTGKALSDLLLLWINKLYESVQISKFTEDDHVYNLTQVLAHTWACKLGNEGCIDTVNNMFQNYKSTDERPIPNLRTIVYCNALRYSNDSSDWEFLWKKFEETKVANDRVALISALGCTQDEEILTRYLQYTIDDTSVIRPQEAVSVFSSVYNSEKGVDVAFKFLRENYEKLQTSYTSLNALDNLISGLADRFTREDQIEELTRFIATLEDGTFKTNAENALKKAQTNLDWLKNTDLEEYFNGENDDDNDDNNDDNKPDSGFKNEISFCTLLFAMLIVVLNVTY